MLLVHTSKITPRLDFAFKHICTRIVGAKVEFTTVIEEFISYQGPKMSYGKQPIGNELFIQAHGLLGQKGIEAIEVTVQPWEESVGIFPVGDRSALPFDIFSGAFFLLSRYEEYLPHLKDEKGRFPAEESLAYQHNFLKVPVIDFWALRFQTLLVSKFPTIDIARRTSDSHYLFDASEPYSYSRKGFLRSLLLYVKDLGKFRFNSVWKRSQVLLKMRKDPYDVYDRIIEASKNSGKRYSIFVRLGESEHYLEGFNSKRKGFVSLIKYLNDYLEVGLMFSPGSLHDYAELKNEKEQLEKITHRKLCATISSSYVVGLPNHYRHLIELEVEKDMTMVYEDKFGFRAGTCTPFLFYDLDFEIKTPLVIYPLAGVSSEVDRKQESETEAQVLESLKHVKHVGGTFAMIVTNRDVQDPNGIWSRIFVRKD